MKRMLAVVLAAGLWLGLARGADAQFSLTVGNPYTGGVSVGVGVPYAGAYAAPYAGYGVVPGAPYYGAGAYGLYPGVTTYSSGYYGIAPPVSTFAYPAYGYRYYGVAPYPRYGYYGYPVRYRGFGRWVGGFW